MPRVARPADRATRGLRGGGGRRRLDRSDGPDARRHGAAVLTDRPRATTVRCLGRAQRRRCSRPWAGAAVHRRRRAGGSGARVGPSRGTSHAGAGRRGGRDRAPGPRARRSLRPPRRRRRRLAHRAAQAPPADVLGLLRRQLLVHPRGVRAGGRLRRRPAAGERHGARLPPARARLLVRVRPRRGRLRVPHPPVERDRRGHGGARAGRRRAVSPPPGHARADAARRRWRALRGALHPGDRQRAARPARSRGVGRRRRIRHARTALRQGLVRTRAQACVLERRESGSEPRAVAACAEPHADPRLSRLRGRGREAEPFRRSRGGGSRARSDGSRATATTSSASASTSSTAGPIDSRRRGRS